MKLTNPKELEDLRKQITEKRDPDKSCVIISTKSTCCYLRGSEKVAQAFKDEIKKQNLEDKVDMRTTGCLGFCEVEPITVIHPKGICNSLVL